MKPDPLPDRQAFRFRAARGQPLAEEILRIEALATDSLRAGVSFASVQLGALAMLRGALEAVAGELVPARHIPACAPAPEPPRYDSQEDRR